MNIEHDLGFLERKITFLEDRANEHLAVSEKEEVDATNRHLLCAATLLRDAGSVAVYIEDAPKASMFFRKSGKIFANAGLFFGYSLLEICGDGEGYKALKKDFASDRPIESIFFLKDGREVSQSDSREAEYRRVGLLRSLSSAQQLFSLYHASCRIGEPDDIRLLLSELVFIRDVRPESFGPFSLEYLRMLYVAGKPDFGRDRLFREWFGIFESETSISRLFEDVILFRDLRLSNLRKDKWHWKILANHDVLIDFNLLAIATLMARSFGSMEVLNHISEIYEGRDNLLLLPIKAASLFFEQQM